MTKATNPTDPLNKEKNPSLDWKTRKVLNYKA